MPIISKAEAPSNVITASTGAMGKFVATQPPAQEVPVAESSEAMPGEAAAATESKEEMLSPRLVALTRQHRRQQAEFRAREEEMKKKLAAYEQDYIPKNKLLEDPLGVLNAQGVTYDKLVEYATQYPTMNDPVIKQIREELSAIKEEKTQSQKLQEETQAKQYEQALNTIRNEAKMMIDSDPAYETVKEEGQQETVVALIEETFREDGRLMSVEEAAQQVEDALIEDAVRKANLKKVKLRLQPAQTAAVESPLAQAVAQKKPPQNQPIRTITNAATSVPSKPLSASDRRARAMAAFRGEL